VATIALFLTARLRLRFGNDGDDFARHRIDQKNLVFHFRIAVVGKLRNLLSQFGRKAIRLDAFRQLGADYRVEVLGGLGRFESELNLRVLGQQGLTNPLALRVAQVQLRQRWVLRHDIAAALFDRAARVIGGRRQARR